MKKPRLTHCLRLLTCQKIFDYNKMVIAILFAVLCMPFNNNAQNEGIVAQQVNATFSADAQTYQMLSATRSAQEYSSAVSEGLVFDFVPSTAEQLRADHSGSIKLEIPFDNTAQKIELNLIPIDIHGPGFYARASNKEDMPEIIDYGSHYMGIVSGQPNSLVEISVFGNEVMGFIKNNKGSFSIGKLQDSETAHIIYNNKDLLADLELSCGMEDDDVKFSTEDLEQFSGHAPGDCVGIYVEAGQSVWNSFGGNSTSTMNFLNGVFAQSFVLYANDGMTLFMSQLFFWTTPDPYIFNTTSQQLGAFQAATNAPLPGGAALGHLVEVQNIGGLAAGFSGVCNANVDNSLCFSGFSGNAFNNVPTPSFNVFIISHEMGHLMGSRHTHACVWNGNNTAIDGCSGFTEGPCPVPGSPAGGGTIMSYCWNDPVGVDFTQGFHPQPTAVMVNTVNNATCLSNCAPPPPAPANDLIANAAPINCGSNITIDITNATGNDDPGGACTIGASVPGVWYTFVGNGDLVTITTCNPGSNYDTHLGMLTGFPGPLTCVANNDDDFACGLSIFRSTIAAFPTVVGTTYHVYVSGFAGATGTAQLTMSCAPACTPDCGTFPWPPPAPLAPNGPSN